jgi:lipoprotein LpqH
MKTITVAVTVAALVTGGSAGCSSGPPPAKPRHGVLPAGTARLTIDGNDAGTTGSVECAAVDSVTTIRTGDNSAGVTVGLSNAAKLTVDYVRIRNLNGFSGDYNLGLVGDAAAAALTESTYHITGAAFGFKGDAIAPTTQQFAIEVTC